MDEAKAFKNRLILSSRTVTETWETLSNDEQTAWAHFFANYTERIIGVSQSDPMFRAIGGGLSQLWALAHDYHRLYGYLWK